MKKITCPSFEWPNISPPAGFAYRKALAACALLALFVGPSHTWAQVVFDNGDGDNVWGNGLNWVGGSPPSGTDAADLDGFTVEVNAAGAIYDVFANSPGTININNGGELTATGTSSSFSPFRYITGINVNNGGTLNAGDSNYNRTDLTVNAGGVLNGLQGMQDSGSSVVLNGGTWNLAPNTSGTHAYEFWIRDGTVDSGTGTIVLDLFSLTEYEKFTTEDGAIGSLILSTGTIELSAQFGVTAGDTFDLVQPSANIPGFTINYGTGANVVLTNAPGFTLDTSNWATDGSVTVIAVPEPTTAFLLLGGAGLLLTQRRRFRKSGALR